MGNKSLAAIVVSAAFWVTVSQAAQADKVGYVDLQKAMQSVGPGRAAKDQLTKEFERKKKELQTKQDELKKLKEEFDKKSMVMNSKTRETQAADLQAKAAAFQELVGQSQMQMQEKERELTAPILDEMKKIIEDVAKEKNVSMMLEKTQSAVLFAPKENDYTDNVIEKYEAKNKKK